MYEQEIGRRLRHVRESRNLSRKDVESMTNGEFKESILAMYEKARRRIPVPRLKQLADLYGVSVAWLMGEVIAQENNGNISIEAILMTNPSFTENERRLVLDILEIIKARHIAEGKETNY